MGDPSKVVEPEEEIDFLAPEEASDGVHGPLSAAALEGGVAPSLENIIAR
jgi:hypothetical protein